MKRIQYDLNGVQYYIEINQQRYPVRQVIKEKDGRILNSAMDDILPEAQLTINEERHTLISEEDFEKVWIHALQQYKEAWTQTKKDFPIGKEIEVTVKRFYPHGIICQDNDDHVFMTTDEAYTPVDEVMVYLEDTLEGVVSGYDDEYMWVIFKSE